MLDTFKYPCEFNFEFFQGQSQIKNKQKLFLNSFKETDIRRIILYVNGPVLYGMQFYSATDNLIYESRYKQGLTL